MGRYTDLDSIVTRWTLEQTLERRNTSCGYEVTQRSLKPEVNVAGSQYLYEYCQKFEIGTEQHMSHLATTLMDP